MKTLVLPLILLAGFFAFGQKTEENYSRTEYKTGTCKAYFQKEQLAGEVNEARIQTYLVSKLANLRDERTGLKLNYVQESPGGFHYSFTQTFQGVNVYQSEVKLNVSKGNTIHSVFDNSENTWGWVLNVDRANSNSVIALHPITHQPILTERRIENNYFEVLEANGEEVFRTCIVSFFAVDSMVTGKVFNPDPLTTSGNVYGVPFIDDTNKTNPSLDAQLQTVSFKAKFTDSVFTLESSFIRIVDFDVPNVPPATSNTAQFIYDRSQSGFEDVNAFYHMSTMQSHINSLGFNCANGIVEVDPHALSGSDQSYFSPGSFPNKIYFGDGNVDDAEDADVCVHEYGHFVSETASPSSNYGMQRTSLDEGFCDYLAGSYSKALNSFNDQWTFNWDGHNEFWKGRILNTTRIYPDSLTSSIYRNGEMWAASLYELHNDIGRVATDSLILQAHYSYTQNMSMADGAQLVIDAVTLLNNGKYYCPIYKALLGHGFVGYNPNNGCTVGIAKVDEPELLFMQDGVSFTIRNLKGDRLPLKIMDVSGQLVGEADINTSVFNYQNSNLSAGVYLVCAEVGKVTSVFKWCKLKQ